MYRIFIDEVGNHDMSSSNPCHQYLGLTGAMMRLSYEQGPFTAALETIKALIFNDPTIVFHRREMLNASPPFEALRHPELRRNLDACLLRLLAEATYRVFTVVIDKVEHRRRYTVWRFQPYHYCLTIMLERYVQFLVRMNLVGDVMAESRGQKENRQLERAFHFLYDHGTDHVPAKTFQERLTSRDLKLKVKTANISGLQFVDMIASPSCRSLICEKTNVQMTARFGMQIEEILRRNKYLRSPANGTVVGWGKKWLP